MADVDIVDRLHGIDRPRPLPAGLRGRIEGALSGSPAEYPRPLPAAFRERLEAAILDATGAGRAWRVHPTMGRRVLGVAAVTLVLLGLVGALNHTPVSGPGEVAQPGSGRQPSSRGSAAGSTTSGSQSLAGEATAGQGSPGVTFGGSPPATLPPPRRGLVQGGRAAPDAAAVAPASTEVVIAVIGGHPGQEAGFTAYLGYIGEQIGGSRVVVVPAEPGESVEGAVATVNLSGRALASAQGSQHSGVLIETATASSGALTDDVFSFSAPIDRVAHLAAAASFRPGEGGTAAIYHPPGEGAFADTVPAALTDVLIDRGVTVIRVPFDERAATAFPPADAAFVSLDGAAAAEWFERAMAAGYSPPKGVTAFHPLLVEGQAELPEGTRVLSPYRLGTSSSAGDFIRRRTGGLSADIAHGWATGFYLRDAIARHLYDGASMPDAIRAVEGTAHDLAPPFELRPGTNSRTPEAVIYTFSAGAFHTNGEFHRDPY